MTDRRPSNRASRLHTSLGKLEIARLVILVLGIPGSCVLFMLASSGALLFIWALLATASLCTFQTAHAQHLLRERRLRTRALKPVLVSMSLPIALIYTATFTRFGPLALLVLGFVVDAAAEYASCLRLIAVEEMLQPPPVDEPHERWVQILAFTIAWLTWRGALLSLPFAPESLVAQLTLVVILGVAFVAALVTRLGIVRRIQRAVRESASRGSV